MTTTYTKPVNKIVTVAPSNMGDRLDWDGETKWDVNVKDILDRLNKLENQNVFVPKNTTASIDNPTEYFNLDSDLTGLGMKVFYGNMDMFLDHRVITKTQQGTLIKFKTPMFVKGAPRKATEEAVSGEFVKAGYSEADFLEVNHDIAYDFSGYQFATPVEIIQMFFHQSRCFVRTNDSGMYTNGTIVDPNGWGDWLRL